MRQGRGRIQDVFYDSEDADAQKIRDPLDKVKADEDEYSLWENLVQEVERLEGGLTRNSNPAAIGIFRNVFDCFLAKFPLFFGYWTKYAKAEFAIGGSEIAELVYERGIACIPTSADLWIDYCKFKTTTSYQPEVMRELFERAADNVGLDWQSGPNTFWDEFIKFERQFGTDEDVFRVYWKMIHVPCANYQRHFDQFRQMATSRPVEELADTEVVELLRGEVTTSLAGQQISTLEFERLLRERLDTYHLEIYHKTYSDTSKRWEFEQNIKRHYFLPTELPEEELQNWRKYLDFEETEGDYARTLYLYKRCLVVTACYDEFWLRYIRWLSSQGDKEEDVRLAYTLASSVYVPMCRPAIRLQWARFEEAHGRVDAAKLILDGVLEGIGPHVETLLNMINLTRRNDGADAAIQSIQELTRSESQYDVYVRAALAAEEARILSQCKGSREDARVLFRSFYKEYLDSRYFLINWIKFEMDDPLADKETPEETYNRVKEVHDTIRREGRVGPLVLKDISHVYMAWVIERGPNGCMKDLVKLDVEVNGPFSVQTQMKAKVAQDGNPMTTDRRLLATNGHPGVEWNNLAHHHGEDQYAKYYQEQGEQAPAQPLRFS